MRCGYSGGFSFVCFLAQILHLNDEIDIGDGGCMIKREMIKGSVIVEAGYQLCCHTWKRLQTKAYYFSYPTYE